MKEIYKTGEAYYYEELPCGLKVYLIPLSKKKEGYKVSIQTNFGGAIDKYKIDGKEYNITPGAAHFLEHKMFEIKGINGFKELTVRGLSANAFTSSTVTNYYISKKNNKNFINDLKFFLDMIFDIYLTDENVFKEKGIIKEEINMYDNEPSTYYYRKLREMAFTKHPFINDILGTKEDVESMTKEELTSIYKSFYNPSNMTLVISGNYKEETLAFLRNYPFPKKKIVEIPFFIDELKYGQKEEMHLNVKEKRLMLFAPFESLKSLKEQTSLLITFKALFGNTSKFMEEAKEKNIIDNLDLALIEVRNYQLLVFSFIGEDLEKALKYFKDSFKEEANIDEINAIKRNSIASLIKASNSYSALNDSFQDNLSVYHSAGADLIKDIENISISDIKASHEFIKSLNYNELYIYPRNEENA